MNDHTAQKSDQVALPRSADGETLPSIPAPHPYNRQLSAVIWIVLAWVAGTIVFEITAIGGEPKHVVIETDHKPVTLFFHDQDAELSAPATTQQPE